MSNKIAKNLLLGNSCSNCKWSEKKRVVPDLEVTIDVFKTYQQVCYNPDYVLLQSDDIIVGEFNKYNNSESSFWCVSPPQKICKFWSYNQ